MSRKTYKTFNQLKEKRMYVNLDALKNFDADRVDADELVALFAFGNHLKATYEGLLLEVPEWLKDNTESIKKTINQRREDMLQRALKNAESRLEALKTSEEKRGDLKAEIERLKAALGGK
jgi:hypothetical protein